MSKKTRWITETAVMIALLIALQAATASFGQFVTGSCVNTVLAIAALLIGAGGGLVVALVSPFCAYLLGIGPQLIAIVPAIAVGNAVFVLLLAWLAPKGASAVRKALAVIAAAVCKFAALYALVVLLLCNVLTLPEKQVAVFSTMFSWPQLVTALIGGTVGMAVASVVRKALRDR